MRLLRCLGWVLIGAILVASWPWAIFLFCAWRGYLYLRTPQAPRRRTTTRRL